MQYVARFCCLFLNVHSQIDLLSCPAAIFSFCSRFLYLLDIVAVHFCSCCCFRLLCDCICLHQPSVTKYTMVTISSLTWSCFLYVCVCVFTSCILGVFNLPGVQEAESEGKSVQTISCQVSRCVKVNVS